jgi:hypothetical protein
MTQISMFSMNSLDYEKYVNLASSSVMRHTPVSYTEGVERGTKRRPTVWPGEGGALMV